MKIKELFDWATKENLLDYEMMMDQQEITFIGKKYLRGAIMPLVIDRKDEIVLFTNNLIVTPSSNFERYKENLTKSNMTKRYVSCDDCPAQNDCEYYPFHDDMSQCPEIIEEWANKEVKDEKL